VPWLDPVTYYYPYDAVMDALPRILPAQHWQVVAIDLPTGLLVATTGPKVLVHPSLRFTFRVGGSDETHTVVAIDIGPQHDFGPAAAAKSRAYSIENELHQYLEQYYYARRAADAPLPPPPAASPPPPPVS
jgi:hypothetical protein